MSNKSNPNEASGFSRRAFLEAVGTAGASACAIRATGAVSANASNKGIALVFIETRSALKCGRKDTAPSVYRQDSAVSCTRCHLASLAVNGSAQVNCR